jgi:hypothetical protein
VNHNQIQNNSANPAAKVSISALGQFEQFQLDMMKPGL